MNFITLATKVMLGYPCKPYAISLYGMYSVYNIYVYTYAYKHI